MTTRTIVSLPNPVLRRKARPVANFDADFQTLVDDMVETMRQAPGVGLAAPQVGVSERLIVVEYPEKETDEEDEEAPKRLFVVANPEIKERSEETEVAVEACLSIPGLQGEVERNLAITVKGLNRRGQVVRIKAKGWLARIFQHEIDHLDGIVYPDRATRVWKPTGPVDDNV
jgi:peptide deformylase